MGGTTHAKLRVFDDTVAGPKSRPLTESERAVEHDPSILNGQSSVDAPEINRLGSDQVPVRVYEPAAAGLPHGAAPWATLVWAHGGSFIRGTLDWPEADWVARSFAEAGMRVYSVDYVLASEQVKAPAPANDVAAVLRVVLDTHQGPVFVGGASAGAHLAAAAALIESARPHGASAVNALALVYPTLHRVQREDETIANATASLPEARRFDPERIAEMYRFYLGDQGGEGDAHVGLALGPVGELETTKLAELPPTVIVNAELDDLRVSGEEFAEQLAEAGVPVTLHTQPGTLHGYLNRPKETADSLKDANATIAFIVNELRAILATSPTSHSRSAAMEHELTGPVSLTLPNGRLNPDAVGWATQPIVDTSGIGHGLGRNKRWEYWNVATPAHLIGITVSHIDYACVHEVWVYDRVTTKTHHRALTVIPPRGAVLAPVLEQGRSMARAKNLAIDIDEVAGGTRLRVEIEGVSLDVIAELPEGHERLAVVVPWSEKQFQYTVKDVARPARGSLTIDGVAHEIGGDAGEAWAVLDHGRGKWPYDIAWNWGAGSGRSGGRVIGLQVGAKWTEGSGVSENAFFVDGQMHKIHGETNWQYDESNWLAPWRVTGGGLDATLVPLTNKVTRTDLVVLQSHTDQCFGLWHGTFETADGDRIEFEGLIGWAEAVHNRW